MTGTQLATLFRRYTRTTSTTYTDANALVDTNNVKNEICSLISQKNQQIFLMTATDNLVASTVTAREYALPDDVLNGIATIEAAFESASPTVFVPVLPYPGGIHRLMREINGITESKITNAFSNETPRYILTRRGIYILSGTISAVTSGLRLRYTLYPADLANLTGNTGLHINPTTTSFGVPLQFHELWARRVSIVYKQQQPKPIPLSDYEKSYPADLQNQLDAISNDDLGGEIFGSIPKDTGEQY